MLKDLLMIMFFLAIAMLAVVLRGGTLKVTPGPGSLQIFFTIIKGLYQGILKNPCLKLAFIVIILLISGWASRIYFAGGSTLSEWAINDTPPAPPHETRFCHNMQQMVYDQLKYDIERGIIPFKEGPIEDPHLLNDCPYKGKYQIDRNGCFTCSKHGRAADLPSLKKPRKPVPE